jgi:hypothetical protein
MSHRYRSHSGTRVQVVRFDAACFVVSDCESGRQRGRMGASGKAR